MMTDTSPPSADEPIVEEPIQGRQRSRGAAIAALVIGLLLVALLGASTIKISYFTQAPGSAVPLQELIEIEGTESFAADADITYSTMVRSTNGGQTRSEPYDVRRCMTEEDGMAAIERRGAYW